MLQQYVVKRDGRIEPFTKDKITSRISKLSYGMNRVDAKQISEKVVSGIHKNVTTSELDEIAAETAAQLCSQNHEYGKLAARIAISNLHKNTHKSFAKTVKILSEYKDPKTQAYRVRFALKFLDVVKDHGPEFDSMIVQTRDFEYDYFGFKTLEKSYLLRLGENPMERPQHMLMRASVAMHMDEIPTVAETYNLLSEGWFIHATPTLFNSGMMIGGLASCYLLTMKEDSIKGIYETLTQCAEISKVAGGIGHNVSDIRAQGSSILGTNGTSDGIVPMLRVFNNSARYVDQGGGKRKGAHAVYLEPWHADVFAFLELKRNHGAEELRARDLFYGLWICDLFMKRVEAKGTWSLMCPAQCPGLTKCYGEEFESLYEKYESEGKYVRQVPAITLWQAILESQVESGGPYMLYKDHVNRKSNQSNLGVIQCSNLCTEIVEFVSPGEVAVCNLASLALPKFVRGSRFQSESTWRAPPVREEFKHAENLSKYLTETSHGTFDHASLYLVTKVIVRNLNKVIDTTVYPVPEAKNSNLKHRPIGLGVQGLADAFHMLHMPFESREAQALNKEIFETIYFAALDASWELAAKDGPYSSFQGSPTSKGILQYDMWGVTPSPRWDWEGLKAKIIKDGIRNSLLVAPMPTQSTSQILGNSETMEPIMSNLFVRRTLAGEFIVINRRLTDDLIRLGLWTPQIRKKIIACNGSIQRITEIPTPVRELYKTIWEMSLRVIVDMAADRGAFIDQSQSFNLHMPDVDFSKLTSYHFYTWRKGLKTGAYYTRTRETYSAKKIAAEPELVMNTQFAIDRDDEHSKEPAAAQPEVWMNNEEIRVKAESQAKQQEEDAVAESQAIVCNRENRDSCVSCHS